MGPSLAELYRQWSAADPGLSRAAAVIQGQRCLRQDPLECLFSFICSSNNNIKRIELMLSRLRAAYGADLGEVELPERRGRGPGFPNMYSFPELDQLCKATEEELRNMGFGYRAPYIAGTAAALQELGGREWLLGLRGKDRCEVKEQLVKFPGVGPKVADCVALLSLDQQEAVPIDVHMWRVARRDYDETGDLKGKSLTPALGERVADRLRTRFGSYAGWAQCLLFSAELRNRELERQEAPKKKRVKKEAPAPKKKPRRKET